MSIQRQPENPKNHDAERLGGALNAIWVKTGNGDVEVSIFQSDSASRFRLRFVDPYQKQLSPESPALQLETLRPNGQSQAFRFIRYADHYESVTEVAEPFE